LGQGSSFKIYLPAMKQVNANRESEEDTTKPAFSGETVLVVEDAVSLRDLVCDALSKFGCTVLSACDAQEALQLIKGRGAAIDLLLTDVIMPGMDGAALAKEIRSLWPETKILYMTGHSGEFVRADMLNAGVSLIRKPFTPAELGRKICKMLADKSCENLRERSFSNDRKSSQKAAAARASQ
jgi:CheY-like chemotaxis protein